MNKRVKGVLVLGVLAVTLAPGSASAVSVLRSYQGSDFSENSSSGKIIYACDQEDDGNDVSADFVRTGTSSESHVVDAYGGSCSSTTLSTVVYKHRAVELLPLTDAYGTWQYPK